MFCKVPIDSSSNRKASLALAKMARLYSEGRMITWKWLQRNIRMPNTAPRSLADLSHYEDAYEVLECYLWLSMRFDVSRLFVHK